MAKKDEGRAGNLKGSVYQVGENRYRGEVMLGYKPDGKRNVFRCSGKTEREVTSKIAKAVTDHQAGALVTDEKQTVANFFQHWLETTASRLRPRTELSYESMMRVHILPGLGQLPLRKLSPLHLNAFYKTLLAKGLSARTVQYAHAIIHHALKDAFRWGAVNRNVADLVDAPKPEKKEMRSLSPDQAKAVLRAAEGDPLEALWWLALTTGMRQGELLGLKWADIDMKSGLLQLRRTLQLVKGLGWVEGPPKTKSGSRGMPLPEPTVAALRRHRARQAEQRLAAGARWRDLDFVFTVAHGGPIEATNLLRSSYYPLLERAGVPRVRFHDLRHSFASLLVSMGVDLKIISEILGHGQIGITADTYAHVLPGLKADALARLADMLNS